MLPHSWLQISHISLLSLTFKRTFTNMILPAQNQKRKWTAILLTVFISILLTYIGIYGIGQYGIAVFILTPLFIGFGPTVLYGYKNQITSKQSRQIAYLTLAIFTVGLLIFAMEGLICIAMAAPFAILLTWLGSLIGYWIIQKKPDSASSIMIILILTIPTTAFIEKENKPELTSVVTSITINAEPEIVWKNVIEFPQLNEPKEWLFKTGIAYPINAKIDGEGVGAVRNCNFTNS